MRYRTFDKLGIQVSEISVGTWAMGGLRYGAVDRDDSIRAIRAMLDGGVNLIDTAPAYGYGRSEMVVADAIEGYPRDQVLIADKCGVTAKNQGGAPWKDGRYKPIMRDCEASLGLLKTDYIDFYFVHHRDPDCPIEETMGALNDLKQQGKIRFIGLSNFNQEQIEEAQQFAQIDSIQLGFNMVDQGQRELFEWAQTQGMVNMTFGSLGSGILTGAIREIPQLAENDFRLTFYDYFVQPKFGKIQELLQTLDGIAADHGVPVAQVTLNWSTQKPFVSSALAGGRDGREAAENVAALSWQLSDQEIARIDEEIRRLELDC